MKKVVYIHPKNLDYYEDHEIFSLLNGYSSYIIVDNPKTAYQFKHFNKHIIGNYKKLFIQQLYYVTRLEENLKEIDPDIVVTKEIYSLESFQVHRICKKFKFKHIIIVYENTEFNNSLWGLFPFTRVISLINRNSIFIAVSEEVQRNLIDVGVENKNIFQTYTGLFPKICTENKSEQNRFNILYIGNLFEHKGIKTLIKAFRMLKDAGYSNLFLYIAGRGYLSEYVKSASKEVENLYYLGYISEERKKELYMDSDLFVYPSEDLFFFGTIPRWKEQTATSVMEAMRCGVPIIVSDSGSLPEIIGRQDLIFRQGNAGELSNKILMVYNNKKPREDLGLFNKKRFMEQFDINKNADKINEYIDSLDN